MFLGDMLRFIFTAFIEARAIRMIL